MTNTYKQESKNISRHLMIKRAIELLTLERTSSCCVRRTYVRDLYDFFIKQEESHEQEEVKKIDMSYIRAWENMHTVNIGSKQVHELSVCYLSGPEPENDFAEFISLGVLPQNIWAFESKQKTYLQALKSIDSRDFMQPKLIKTSIEKFFENTPKKFDIIYIDACSPLISDQHALRCISSMFRYQRLSSPGILIYNFAEVDRSNTLLLNEYYDLITKYLLVKEQPKALLVNKQNNIQFTSSYKHQYDLVVNNFDQYYGDFITTMICNSGSITTPALRFVHSSYLHNLTNINPLSIQSYDISDINTIKNNTFYQYIALNKFMEEGISFNMGKNRIDKLVSELSAGWTSYNMVACFQKLYNIRIKNKDIEASLKPTIEFFTDGTMYQFLDKPNELLFYDSVINQLSYPMHYCSDKIYRASYTAKQTKMFTDLILFDECRYIYDWLPAIHQMKNAFQNPSWQYIYRFALDGLVKQRIEYNNEFFFQGSVIRKDTINFESKKISDRIIIH